jgi:chloramphenicol-sensitive protein RarD
LASITTSPADSDGTRIGLIAALVSYLLWGFLPLLFKLLEGVDAAVVVADRTLWSMVLVGIILVVAGRTAEIRAAMADRRTFQALLVASFLLGANWLIYVYAVDSGQVLEASFGYFINPMMNVAIGMVLLGERLNRWQTVSVAIAVVAIAIQAVGLSGIPFIALSLALTFAVYGYIRKTANASSAAGHFVETLGLAPVAMGYLIYSFVRDGGIGPHADPQTLGLLMLTGPATAFPLLLFAFAVRRLRLTTIGMLQYIAPSIAFILAITVFGEHLNPIRLLSFALIWLSLIVYTVDSVVRRSAERSAAATAEAS